MSEQASFFFKVPDNLRDTGYRLVLNRQELLRDRGTRFAQDFADTTRKAFGDAPLDVIGIHRSGNLLATIGHIGRVANGLQGNHLACYPESTFLPWRRRGVAGQTSGAEQLLVDNSRRSGATLSRTLECLDPSDLHGPYFLFTLINYHDDCQQRSLAERGTGSSRFSPYDYHAEFLKGVVSMYDVEQFANSPWLEDVTINAIEA